MYTHTHTNTRTSFTKRASFYVHVYIYIYSIYIYIYINIMYVEHRIHERERGWSEKLLLLVYTTVELYIIICVRGDGRKRERTRQCIKLLWFYPRKGRHMGVFTMESRSRRMHALVSACMLPNCMVYDCDVLGMIENDFKRERERERNDWTRVYDARSMYSLARSNNNNRVRSISHVSVSCSRGIEICSITVTLGEPSVLA